MKKIEALFRRERLAEVNAALQEQGFLDAAISDVEGLATADAAMRRWLVSSRELEALAYVKLELLVHHDAVYRATEAINRGAATGQPGDGTIFVTPVESLALIGTDRPMHTLVQPEVGVPLAD
jgi:nitrogen regulatory protein PII